MGGYIYNEKKIVDISANNLLAKFQRMDNRKE